MSYTAEDKLPEDFFQDTIQEKAEMLRKYLKDMGNPLVLSTRTGPNITTFKFYSPKVEEDSLKLHYTFSNLGDLKEQLYFLLVQLNYALKGE